MQTIMKKTTAAPILLESVREMMKPVETKKTGYELRKERTATKKRMMQELREDWHSVEEIAALFRETPEYVKSVTHVTPAMREKRLAEMQKMREAGYTERETAEKFGMSKSYVAKLTTAPKEVQFANMSRNGKGRMAKGRKTLDAMYEARKAYYVPIMLDLRRQGYANAEIAKKTGFCAATVQRYIGKNPDEIILARVRAASYARKLRRAAVINQAKRDAA